MTRVLILPFTGLLLLAAHFLRFGAFWESGVWLGFAALLFFRQAWIRLVLLPVLGAGTMLWVGHTIDLVTLRIGLGQEWYRLATIMAGTGTIIAGGVFSLLSPRGAARYYVSRDTAVPQAILFGASAGLLWLARSRSPFAVLLADRFLPGSGVMEILLLALYGAWIGGKFLNSRTSTPRLRSGIWTLF